MSGVTADYTSVIRSRWNGKADMSDIGHKLTWINAAQPPPPLISRLSGLQAAKRLTSWPLSIERQIWPRSEPPARNSPSGRASYAGSATETQLRQALAEAEALLREKDLLIHAVLAWREAAANHLAGLTRRQRQIMELVLAGQPSKNIAADLGISQRTVENHRAAIMKRTGSTCLPALARMALAAAWDDATALPPPAGWRNTGGPDFAPTGQAPADWYRGSVRGIGCAGSGCREPVVVKRQRSRCFSGFAMPNARQGASVTNFPTPVRCRSK